MAEVGVKQNPCPWPWYWTNHQSWQVGLWPTVSTQFNQHLMTVCYVPGTVLSIRNTRWINCVSSLTGLKVFWEVKLLKENGAWEDGHVPGLRWGCGTGCQVRDIGFAQEIIQEGAIVQWKEVYLERYAFYRQNVVLRKWEWPWRIPIP